ncbi:MAG: energy-coupled thiamine transporter ThiT [Firmicutes bacterium]|mgnify:CR=1 FL=1|jgi:thiamine transporter|nr:energy-coupled thiamine transporter ThiT [Bacillota bacterium]
MKRRWDTRVMMEIAVAAALALILGMLRLYRMPYGGSITLEMVPILVVSLRHGPKSGAWSGLILGLLKLLLDAYIIHPVQLVMDYPLPYAVLGIAGFFAHQPLTGVIMASIARYVVHVLAGVIFWGSYAPSGTSPWVYSLSYNASYLIPNAILAAVVIMLLMKTPLIKPEGRKNGDRLV